MKRVIRVQGGGVTIKATLDSRGKELTRQEVEKVADALAERLQDAASDLPYRFTPGRHRIAVAL